MRWISYFILAYVALGLQAGLSAFVGYHGAPPNFVLLAVIFIAINAPRDAALLGCFSLGLMQDLLSLEPLGLYALAYGIVGMFVVNTQQIVYRAHPLTHFTLAAVGGLIVALLIMLKGWIHGSPTPPSLIFTTVIYTAVLSPFILGVLQKFNRVFAFQPTRRKVVMR
jgi:rod shape-determining protein MreD